MFWIRPKDWEYGILDYDIVHEYNQFLYPRKALVEKNRKWLTVECQLWSCGEKNSWISKKVIRGFLRMYTFWIQATAYQNEIFMKRYNFLQSLVKMIDVRLGGNDLTTKE